MQQQYHFAVDLGATSGRTIIGAIANGKLLMKDRELIGIDEEAENAHILEEAKKLWRALDSYDG